MVDAGDLGKVANAASDQQRFVVAGPSRLEFLSPSENGPKTLEEPRLGLWPALVYRSLALERLLGNAQGLRMLGNM